MTKSRGIRVRRGTRFAFVEENQGRHFCQCGCGEPIQIVPRHFNLGIPRFVLGHNPRSHYKGRIRHSRGYIIVHRPNHPFADRRHRKVLEHRIVVEEHLRATDPGNPNLIEVGGELYLCPGVDVHHVNGVKDDNRIENLKVLTTAEHARLHHRLKRQGH